MVVEAELLSHGVGRRCVHQVVSVAPGGYPEGGVTGQRLHHREARRAHHERDECGLDDANRDEAGQSAHVMPLSP